MTILKARDIEKHHEDGSTTVERMAIVDGRGREIVPDVVDEAWRQRLIAAHNTTQTRHSPSAELFKAADAYLEAIDQARAFEQENPNDLTKRWDAKLKALEVAENALRATVSAISEGRLLPYAISRSVADQLRLISALTGTSHPQGHQDQREAIAYIELVVADMLEALKGITRNSAISDDWLAPIRAAITKAEGRANG